MKKKVLFSVAAMGLMSLAGQVANAQTVVEETVVVSDFPCETHYYSQPSDNWFIQLGSGATLPLVENNLADGNARARFTAVYNLAGGKWFSPYLGWRAGFMGGKLRWDNISKDRAKWVNANVDIMWDMFNTFGSVKMDRFFSIVPFAGIGGAYVWDITPSATTNILRKNGGKRTNSWTLPVSAGLQMRFNVAKHVDFFLEGRAQFFGDNFNNYSYGSPIDMNISIIGGMSFKLGGCNFTAVNPCDYTTYIGRLNDEVNDMRAAMVNVSAELERAKAQTPTTEVVRTITEVIETPAPLMTTVRFDRNSAQISDLELVNIYNAAQWLTLNPEEAIVLVGYADKDTGTADYNRALAQRRADAVCRILINTYGIDPDRIAIEAAGSDIQPFETNSWNRIVIMNSMK